MKAITGNWARPDGTPAAGAILTLLLSQDGAGDVGQIGHYPIAVTLDENGAIPFQTSIGGLLIETNDEILPAGTYYTVTVKDPVFGQIYLQRLVISGAEPINVNLIAPAAKSTQTPTTNLVRLRVPYTVKSGDINAGFATVDVTWPVAFVDTNYTYVSQLTAPAGKESLYFVNASSKSATGLVVAIGTAGDAGDVVVLEFMAVHD